MQASIINANDLQLIAPELIVTLFACFALVVDIIAPRQRGKWTAYFCLGGLGLAAISTAILYQQYHDNGQVAFSGMLAVDDYALFFKFLLIIIAACSIVIAMRFLDVERQQHGEFYALILFATVGMMFMAAGTDLLSLYISLELMAMSIYILVGYLRGDRRSSEAAMKYFLLGAFSSGILLYGISLIYGAAGSTNLSKIAEALPALLDPNLLKQTPPNYIRLIPVLGMILMAAGMFFKVAAVPFHMWAPDAYEGAPTPVTAFMSVSVKAASFAMFARIFLEGLGGMRHLLSAEGTTVSGWGMIFGVAAAITIVWGNVAATTQANIKRLFAYSSIAHAGYLLLGLVAGNQTGYTGVLIYLLVYSFMNLGAWTVVIALRRQNIIGDQVDDLSGLMQKSPTMAIFMLVFLLALAGIPPTAGFIGKYYIFLGLIEAGSVEQNNWMFVLAVLAVVMTAVSVYYYYRIVKAMFLTESRESVPIQISRGQWATAIIAFAFTLLIGILPQYFINQSANAAKRFPVYTAQPNTTQPRPASTPQTGQLR